MKTGVRMVKDNLQIFKNQTAMIEINDTLVGIPMEENARDDSPIGNAGIGFINEYGSPEQNIPARPHLVPSIRAKKNEIAEVMKVGLKELFDKGNAALTKAHNAAGIIGQNAVKAWIRAQEGFTPLAEKTLAARARDGKKGTLALIRTGSYLNSFTYVVRKRGAN
jgi:hypothetical protein